MTETLIPRQTIVLDKAKSIRQRNSITIKLAVPKKRKRSAYGGRNTPLAVQADKLFYNTYSRNNLTSDGSKARIVRI